LARTWTDGRIKQFIIARVLAVRKIFPVVFSDGNYLPLEVRGPMAEHVVAFGRNSHDSCAVTVVCRSIASFLSGDHTLNMPESHWQDTRLCFPSEFRGRFSDALRPSRIHSFDSHIDAGEVLGDFPIAFMTNYSAPH
jgi:(1->4)-alpha-D-glucan 1-alpha-D-glucosylmutase